MKKNTKYLLEFLFLIVLFLIVTYFVETNLGWFESKIGDGYFGFIVFLLILIITIVVAPVSSIPFVPLTTHLWGWVLTGVILTIGWSFGAILAFYLARKYGVPFVKKFVSMERVYKMESHIPRSNLFWGTVLLRIIGQIAVVSYALGLFTTMKYKRYIYATFLGIAPFSFFIAYLGNFPLKNMVLALAVLGVLLIIGLVIVYRRKNNLKKNSVVREEFKEKEL
jgi:uncharacterized membrane protein YdjX (TVP38/TMEM64 family)